MKQNLWRRLLLYIVGIVIMPLGAVLTIQAHLGAGGYDAMNFALAKILGIKTSYAIYLTSFIILMIAAVIRKGKPRILTFVTSYFIGLTTDFWKMVLEKVEGTNLITSILILLAGLVMVAIGVAAYMLSEFPTNPTDDVIVACREKNISIKKAKILLDVACVVIAICLRGEIGLGTIVCTFGLGPMIDVIHGWMERSSYYKAIVLENKKQTFFLKETISEKINKKL